MTAETHLIDGGHVDKEQLMAYLDGQLSPDAAVGIAAHLSECVACHAVAEEFRNLSENLSAWTVEDAPGDLSRNVMHAAESEFAASVQNKSRKLALPMPFYRRTLLSKPFWAAAACVLVAGALFWKTFAPGRAEQVSDKFSLNSPSRIMPGPQTETAPPPAGIQKLLEEKSRNGSSSAAAGGAGGESTTGLISGPDIARTASLKVSVKDLGTARATLDRIVSARGGYVASININTPKDEPRSLDAELHIPANLIDSALADIRALGHVEQEQQGGEEVTAQVVDLDARLKNAREAEARLEEILRTRTGKLSDVLDVEQQISSTREEIERMEGEQKQLQTRITYASIQVNLHEEYAAALDSNPTSFGRRIRNAFVDGTSTALDGLTSLALAILYAGPTLILAAIILFWPARWAWRRMASARKA
jgi:hypothetical protein